MPKKVEAETRENYWKDRKLYRVLKSENVSTQISFLIGTFNTLVNILITHMYYRVLCKVQNC